MIIIFYLYRNKPWSDTVINTLSYLPKFNGNKGNPLALKIGNHAAGFEIFALLALPFIYLHIHTRLKIFNWFFYIYFPLQLFLIYF